MLSTKKESLDLYWEIIQSGSLSAASIREVFLMRVAAFSHLADEDVNKRAIAKQFLLKTMTQSEEEYDFTSKMAFVATVQQWGFPEIVTQRSDDIYLLIYKINIVVNGAEQTLHEASFFKKDDQQHFLHTHKYDINALSVTYCNKPAAALQIRQIGDPVLHKRALPVTDFSASEENQMKQQLEILKAVLYETGGVGIAANQCLRLENPLSVIIAGVNYENPEHTVKAIKRYPTALFPKMQVYINPEVVSESKEYEVFPEGCLSVQGILRGLVLRPSSVTIAYQDETGSPHTKMFIGSDARVMLHELDHIQHGKVYIQRIIEELSIFQLQKLEELMKQTLAETHDNQVVSVFSQPIVVFNRDQAGRLAFEDNNVLQVLKKIPKNTLQGVYEDVRGEMKRRDTLQFGLAATNKDSNTKGGLGSSENNSYQCKF